MNGSPTSDTTRHRRTVLRRASLAALAAVAGCLGDGAASAGGSGDGSQSTSTGTGTPTRPPTRTAPTEPTTTEPTEPPTATPVESIDDWLAGAVAYDGHVTRVAPDEPARVKVGVSPADSPADHYAFGPPAIEVTPGTTVTWEWTGHGGAHDVVAVTDAFDSGEAVATHGHTFSHTFESTGDWAYYCTPHRSIGMRGAVLVRERPTSGNETVDGWLSGVDNYDGEIVDWTGADTATILAGARGNGGQFAFEPPAVRVSADTTVQWKWTGDGGGHTVTFVDTDVGSRVDHEAGVHFERSFEAPGTYRYACQPHRALGGKGAIVVE